MKLNNRILFLFLLAFLTQACKKFTSSSSSENSPSQLESNQTQSDPTNSNSTNNASDPSQENSSSPSDPTPPPADPTPPPADPTPPPSETPPTNNSYSPHPYLSQLPDKTWSQLPNTKMTSVASTMFYNGVSTSYGFGIFAYSGAVKDSTNGIIYFWGGGHEDYYGNEVYKFDLKTLKWERVTDPSPKAGECASYNNHHTFSDGQPKTRHTYDQMVFVSHLNKIWAHGGSICGSGAGISDMWLFDPILKKWKDLIPELVYSWSNNLAISSEYDPVSKNIFHFYTDKMKKYNIDENKWTAYNSFNFNHPSERSAVLDPSSRKIVLYGGYETNQISIFDLTNESISFPIVPTEVPSRRGAGWTFDSKNKLYVAYGGFSFLGKALWYYDVLKNTWFSETIPNGPSANDFIYERLMYDDVNNVTYYFKSPYENIWVLKNQNPQR